MVTFENGFEWLSAWHSLASLIGVILKHWRLCLSLNPGMCSELHVFYIGKTSATTNSLRWRSSHWHQHRVKSIKINCVWGWINLGSTWMLRWVCSVWRIKPGSVEVAVVRGSERVVNHGGALFFNRFIVPRTFSVRTPQFNRYFLGLKRLGLEFSWVTAHWVHFLLHFVQWGV